MVRTVLAVTWELHRVLEVMCLMMMLMTVLAVTWELHRVLEVMCLMMMLMTVLAVTWELHRVLEVMCLMMMLMTVLAVTWELHRVLEVMCLMMMLMTVLAVLWELHRVLEAGPSGGRCQLFQQQHQVWWLCQHTASLWLPRVRDLVHALLSGLPAKGGIDYILWVMVYACRQTGCSC